MKALLALLVTLSIPLPANDNEPLRQVDWATATIAFDRAEGLCGPEAAHLSRARDDSGLAVQRSGEVSRYFRTRDVAFGDLTGDGVDEALIVMDCRFRWSYLHVREAWVVQRHGDGRLHRVAVVAKTQSAWLEDGAVIVEQQGAVSRLSWDQGTWRIADASHRYPQIKGFLNFLGRSGQPYALVEERHRLLVLDHAPNWTVVATLEFPEGLVWSVYDVVGRTVTVLEGDHRLAGYLWTGSELVEAGHRGRYPAVA